MSFFVSYMTEPFRRVQRKQDLKPLNVKQLEIKMTPNTHDQVLNCIEASSAPVEMHLSATKGGLTCTSCFLAEAYQLH